MVLSVSEDFFSNIELLLMVLSSLWSSPMVLNDFKGFFSNPEES